MNLFGDVPLFGVEDLQHAFNPAAIPFVVDVPQARVPGIPAIAALIGADLIEAVGGFLDNLAHCGNLAVGGGLAGLAACLLVLQYDIYPAIGLSFGPITFMMCVLGGLGNMIGGFVAAFIFSQVIAVGGFYFELEWGYVIAFAIFIVMMFIRPQGILGRRS